VDFGEEQLDNSEFLSTGIEKLDNLLEGGILKGFTTLILGSPGSSIEILCKQLAVKGHVLYITTEETQQEVMDAITRFGWTPENIEFIDIATKYSESVLSREKKRVSIYEQRSKLKLKELIEIGSSGVISTVKGEEDFLAIFSNQAKTTNSEKVILNSLDFFLGMYSQDEVLRTLHAAKVANIERGGVLFIIMTMGIHGDVFERKMEGMADCVLELNVIQKGSTFERFLAVKKMRNYAKKIGIARYAIDTDGFVLEMIERIM
jgi:KaiC/GvpD/RAD55 family RecA-like ATPase